MAAARHGWCGAGGERKPGNPACRKDGSDVAGAEVGGRLFGTGEDARPKARKELGGTRKFLGPTSLWPSFHVEVL